MSRLTTRELAAAALFTALMAVAALRRHPRRLRPVHAAGVRRPARRHGARRHDSARSASPAYLDPRPRRARSTRAARRASARCSARRAATCSGSSGRRSSRASSPAPAERTLPRLLVAGPGRARADLRARRDVARRCSCDLTPGTAVLTGRRAVRVAGRAEGGGGRAHGASAGQPAAGSSCRDPERPLTSASAWPRSRRLMRPRSYSPMKSVELPSR